jgi:hypothetical protein
MAAAVGAQPGPARDKPECADPATVPNVSSNCPDHFAWTKFLEVNAPIAGTDLVLWQTWASDPDTFPPKPEPSQCGGAEPAAGSCPTWPKTGAAGALAEMLLPSKRNADLVNAHDPAHTLRVAAAMAGTGRVPPDLGAIAGETIHRNRVTFDYIVANDLWYQEGLAERFAEDFAVDFPIASIEVKLNWLDLEKYDLDPTRYFTVEMDGATMGLVAMHVSTKDLPNWFWSTFEHVDNPGRCDYLGCRDSFGVDPALVAPHDTIEQPYPPGALRAPLLALMEAAGLDAVFRNYRLKASQIDFTDSTGEATLAGNSVTEYGFVPTASCITCHGRAAVDLNGQKPAILRIFGERADGQSFNGSLDSELFYDGSDPVRRYLMQVDFLWAIPFRAQPIGGAQSGK